MGRRFKAPPLFEVLEGMRTINSFNVQIKRLPREEFCSKLR